MAFKQTNLTKIANLNNINTSGDITPSFFLYDGSADGLAAVVAAGYFNSIASQVSVNSVIMVHTTHGMHTLKVTAVVAGVVTVAHLADADQAARGQATTVTAVDTIVTGLAGPLTAVFVTENSDPVDDPEWCTASIGDQAGAPAAGSFYLKTWKNTAGNDPTPLAATTFGKVVNWQAFG